MEGRIVKMEMMLQTQNLCKYFRKQKAVNNASLNIEKKQIYGLLGPNGAGKSTTLKMLTGMMKPTAGKIYFDGKLWDRKDLSKIGALIENPPIYENLSARENLKVRQLLLGTDENRIDEVLQIVSLTNTGKKKAGQFSLGMKQRLGIAMALLGEPELLILDEPTNGLDPIGIEELRELIRSFPEQGITVILSSHILSEVQLLADKVGIISGGILGYEGALKQGDNLEDLFMNAVINRQTNRFTIIPNRSLKNKATGISHNSETVRNNTAINAPFTGTCVVRRKPPSVAPANTITLENKIMYPI